MLNNFLQIIFFNQYIVSPQTWVHKIPNKLKIFSIFTYLFLVTYFDYKYIIVSIIINILTIINLPAIKKYVINFKQILCILLLFLFNICIFGSSNNNFTSPNLCQQILKINNIKNTNLCYTNQSFRYKHQQVYINRVPAYIFRGMSIYFIYFMLLKIIYLTTRYENIIQCCTLIYKSHIDKRCIFYKDFIIIFGYQFTIFLTYSVDIFMKAIVLRGCLINRRNMCSGIFDYLLNIISCDIKKVSSALYYREIYNTVWYVTNENKI